MNECSLYGILKCLLAALYIEKEKETIRNAMLSGMCINKNI